MQLQDKNAVIYGAGGSLGGAIARAFAAAGAKVFVTGRHSVQSLADEIGGVADIVDAFDEKAVNDHLAKMGRVDISFNAVGVNVIQDIPLIDLPVTDYIAPLTQTMHTRFLTATAAGRIMKQQGYGVILSLTATPGGIGYPYTGGFSAVCAASENLVINLASELGIHGVRVVNIRSGGSPDSKVFADALKADPAGMEKVLDRIKTDTMLKQMPLMADIANTAVFLASDMGRMITGVTVDLTAGTTTALSHLSSSKK
jgi:3-oxoacyl-[acyl-carrier protein] reductase